MTARRAAMFADRILAPARQESFQRSFGAVFMSARPSVDPGIQNVAVISLPARDHHGRESEVTERGRRNPEVGRSLGGRQEARLGGVL